MRLASPHSKTLQRVVPRDKSLSPLYKIMGSIAKNPTADSFAVLSVRKNATKIGDP